MAYILVVFIGYFLGSLPTAVWVGKIRYNLDVREHGSKNAGATNTFRVLGKNAGIFVLSVDVLKGALAVLAPLFLFNLSWNNDFLIQLKIIGGVSAVLGHIFPLFAGFRGGKGVATSLGIILGIHPLAALTCVGIFLIVFILSNFVSLGAIIAAISFPLAAEFLFLNENDTLRIFSWILSAAVIVAHRKNIQRLIRGNENKMNLFKK
ncbi:MAG: glycerol-3-phosphate 1-O-acyltransferase PlsY [Bacteroidota bacterium]